MVTSSGLDKFDKSTGLFTRCKDIYGEGSLIHNDVVTLHIDRKGILWISTRNGLCSFDRNNKFVEYNDLFKKYGITDRYITCIYEDSDGILWIGCGYDGGLIRFDKENMLIKSYVNDKNDENDENSLSYNSVKSIAEDDEGNLWVSTNGGIFKLVVKENRVESFDSTNGFQSNEFNVYFYHKNKEGIMYFAGIKGIDFFNPKYMSIQQNDNMDIKVESILINGQEDDCEEHIDLDNNKIILPHDKNNLLIEVFVSDYRNP